MTTDRLTREDIALYIQRHTAPAKVTCSKCNGHAELYDVPAGELVCEECLIDGLNDDIKAVREEFLK